MISERATKLQNTPVCGSHEFDRGLFDLAYAICLDPQATLEEKRVAVMKLNEAVGEDDPTEGYTEEYVNGVVADLQEALGE